MIKFSSTGFGFMRKISTVSVHSKLMKLPASAEKHLGAEEPLALVLQKPGHWIWINEKNGSVEIGRTERIAEWKVESGCLVTSTARQSLRSYSRSWALKKLTAQQERVSWEVLKGRILKSFQRGSSL
jgi:hypothetical protein